MSSPSKTRRERRLVHPARAVIDIGSNTVRLVVYEGSPRAPRVVWNEKVAARLGRDLSETGRIPEEAADEALGALARYAQLIEDLEIEDVKTVATAAARDAENGREFLDAVARTGLEPRLLTGEEEACASAMGAIGAFPGAHGVVADLGGGSLELVSIGDGECRDAASLPLGTLRLPALRARSDGAFEQAIHDALGTVGWASAHEGPLFMVGGTWRALAAYAMRQQDYPLTDPHSFILTTQEAREFADKLMTAKPKKLSNVAGIGSMRAEYLPDAAAMLRPLLDELQPEGLVFSSWGLREGLLFSRLDTLQRGKDPLLAGVAEFSGMYGALITDATLLAGWTVELAGSNGGSDGNERLRLAGAQLSAALHRVEPNLRYNHALEWALDKRWIDCDARCRAMLCASLIGSLGRTDVPDRLPDLASDDDLREALTWGLGFRLARGIGAASRAALGSSALIRRDGRLVLLVEENRAALARDPVDKDLDKLAGFMGLDAEIEIGPLPAGA